MSSDEPRAALLDLHRAVARRRASDARARPRPHGRREFLRRAADDPKLAWPAPRSELVAALDEAEAGAEEAERPEAVAARARALLAPPDPATPFGRNSLSLLQRSAEVVMAHRAGGAAFARGGR